MVELFRISSPPKRSVRTTRKPGSHGASLRGREGLVVRGANAQALTARMQNALGPERSLELLLDAWSEFQLQSADDSCLFLGQKRGSYL